MFDELENPEILQRTTQGRIQKSCIAFVVGDKRWLINGRSADWAGKDLSWLIDNCLLNH